MHIMLVVRENRRVSIVQRTVRKNMMCYRHILKILLKLLVVAFASCGTREDDCIVCSSSGKYAPLEGSGECQLRDRGKYANDFGSDICLSCPEHTYTLTTGSDTCLSCERGKHLPEIDSTTCVPCGSGTHETSDVSSICTDCKSGVFSGETAYLGLCSVTQTEIQIQSIPMTMYSDADNTLWFDTAENSVSLLDILNNVPIDWTAGAQVHMGSALGESNILNPVVLRRIRIGDEDLWSPGNVEQMHTSKSTQYHITL